MDELLDIVDQNDKVIGQMPYSLCHQKRIYHRGAGIICFKDNSFNEILISKRSLIMKSSAGRLCIPGGHVMAGESYQAAAVREFTEEMLGNIKIDLKFEPIFKIKKSESFESPEFLEVFQIIYGGPFEIDPKEVSDCFFIELTKVLEEIKTEKDKYSETTAFILEEYAKELINV